MTTIGDIHKHKIAKKTIAMTEEMVETLGGMTKAEARRILGLPEPKTKRWTSPIPKRCDICHKSLANDLLFVDGKTRSGPWAIMCSECYDTTGVGIGLGLGQAYNLSNGEKIAGQKEGILE